MVEGADQYKGTKMLKIALYECGSGGFVVAVENEDGSEVELTRYGAARTPKGACRKAAKALRTAAARFDLLAETKAPVQGSVQSRINRTRVAS